jgi:hypothetical protein
MSPKMFFENDVHTAQGNCLQVFTFSRGFLSYGEIACQNSRNLDVKIVYRQKLFEGTLLLFNLMATVVKSYVGKN